MADQSLPRIPELIVVEGVHDWQRVREAVEADVWVLGGERFSRATYHALRRAVQVRGVILLTDPDGPGQRIRQRIDRAVPGCLHAHLPKRLAVGGQKLGIEHAQPEDIRQVLLAVRRPRVQDQEATANQPFTIADLQENGLTACPEAMERRQWLGDWLGIGGGNSKSFVYKLNALGVTREEWRIALERLYDHEKETHQA
ncbi:toprim domain-containing protein [Alicyclobacillus tolerans]|uniref:Ribonuclease M5 n=2 Tax=Alicyclobacillus tolerans TaxID=90970 RepID=A0ABT9LYH8_9BACL|nr:MULTISPECIES: DUF4093 domain-containing protein [Alicyclobacillus]MDP9729305.1 ribonuclease M5 [Alicyclobacillus tengchongensis]QRF22339.1 DUF4093 domain-containing protein [Alicyclobacillus sp. TC]SHK07749.1 ribonuclease M5 [Alicyclobacillus montanus]